MVALVITIIIIIILATVAINFAFGDNGLIKRAEDARDFYANDTAYTDESIANVESYLNDILAGTGGGSGSGSESTTEDGVQIPEGLKVGSEVSYNPSGTYEWKDEYCNGAPQYGNLSKNLSSATGEDFNIDTWKVFDINKITGEIILVPAYSTKNSFDSNGYVSFRGYQGYNNAVKLLNDACSALYGNSSKGITARSINIEDIEGKMTEDALNRVHSYNGNYTTTLASYGNQVEKQYSIADYYPTIYEQEVLSSVDGEERASSGLGVSEQTSFIEPNEAIKKATALRPTQTFWFDVLDESDFKIRDGTNYFNLLLKLDNAEIVDYWIASRCVDTDPEWFSFNIYTVSQETSNAVFAYPMAESDTYGNGLFPVVSLSADLITETNGKFEVVLE